MTHDYHRIKGDRVLRSLNTLFDLISCEAAAGYSGAEKAETNGIISGI